MRLLQGREWFRILNKLLYHVFCSSAVKVSTKSSFASWPILTQPGVQTTQGRNWLHRAGIQAEPWYIDTPQLQLSIKLEFQSYITAVASIVETLPHLSKFLWFIPKEVFAPYTNAHHRLANIFHFHLKEISTTDRIPKTSTVIGAILIIWV